MTYTVEKITGHESAQAKIVRYEDGSISLKSYNTFVCGINPDGFIWCNGLYSRTTIKHIGWFAKLIGCSYYDFKNCYELAHFFNIHTGEVITGV